MALIPAKCSSCGALLEIDSGEETVTCKYCNASLSADQAIALFRATYPVQMSHADRIAKRDFFIRGRVLVKYDGPGGDVIIPDGVKVIGEMAFAHSAVSSVIIPNTVAKLGWRAFCMCHQLREVTIPGSVKELGAAVYCCFSLRSVRLLDGVKHIGENAFQGCGSLTSVYLPKSVEYISYYHHDEENGHAAIYSAFNDCPRISYVEFGGERFEKPFQGTRWWRENTEEGIRITREEQHRKQLEQWKKAGKCLYCGGDLKGIFNIRCTRCGREPAEEP